MKMKSTLFFSLLLCGLLLLSFSPITGAQQSISNLTVTTDQQSYCSFCPVTINGNIKSTTTNENIALQVASSKGGLLVLRSVNTAATTASSMPAQINSAFLSDLTGSSRYSIDAGNLGYFAINLMNNDNVLHNMLVTVNIYDSSGIPIGIAVGETSLLPGRSGTAMLSIQIPIGVHSGVAFGYANVFTDYPNEGGFPLAVETQFQFTVNGALNSANSSAAKTTAHQDAYSLTFRLPTKGSPDGVYTVYVASSGTLQPKTVSFDVFFVDFTGDGDINFQDITFFVSAYIKFNQENSAYTHICDLNHDSQIGFPDILLLVNGYIKYGSS